VKLGECSLCLIVTFEMFHLCCLLYGEGMLGVAVA